MIAGGSSQELRGTKESEHDGYTTPPLTLRAGMGGSVV